MKLLGNRILVRISHDSREGLFSKEIINVKGEKVKLFTNVPAQDRADERISALFVQVGTVIAVSEKIEWIEIGDTAIVDYTLSNSEQHLMYSDDEGDVFWLDAVTTYHNEDYIIEANRKNRRTQIVHGKGECDNISLLYGIVRGDKLIANDPYVFLNHESTLITKVSAAGLMFEEKQKIVEREVLAVSGSSMRRISGLKQGVKAILDDYDNFTINLEGKKIDCINDIDIMALRP